MSISSYSRINSAINQPSSSSVLDNQANKLPIHDYKDALIYLLERNDIIIVVGDTGSGKSTYIPQFLYSTGCYNQKINHASSSKSSSNPSSRFAYQQICITQPRRVATLQLARRVALDMSCNVGDIVGYTIKFKDESSEKTMIKYVTEGLLMREMISDPLLTRYSVIIVDEVHERNIQCDILLGLLRSLLMKRNDLKLILCSATINIEEIQNFYSYSKQELPNQKNIVILSIEGRKFPIRIYHRVEVVADYLESTIRTAIDIHESNRLASGKILAFLTGQDEVEYVCDKLRDYAEATSNRLELRELNILPLYASLRPDEVARIFEDDRKNVRTCIIATNVAETSLTIDGIAFVIDCGFIKIKQYQDHTGMDHLIRVPISKSSANQRAGRAGRTRDGIVYRLYRKKDYDNLLDYSVPEIQRTSMVEPLMLLMSLGIRHPASFPLISPMPKHNLMSGIELLHSLDILDDQGRLTVEGEIICYLDIDPKLAKALIQSTRNNCSVEVAKIVAMLQVKEIYCKSADWSSQGVFANESLERICVSEGDLLSYLNIMNSFLDSNRSKKWAERRNLNYQALLNACDIATKLEMLLKKFKLKVTSSNRIETIQKSLVAGLFTNAAYLHPNGDYKTVIGDEKVYIHPTSVLAVTTQQPGYLIFVEIMNTTKPFVRHLMAVEYKWLLEVAPHYYTFSTELEFRRSRFR